MADTKKITVLIEAVNERDNLVDCIKSAQLLTDSVVVIDQHSSDGSGESARNSGATVYQHDQVQVVEEIRGFGIAKVRSDWVFIMDADERMTEELAREITAVIDGAAPHTHYRVPRRNIFGRSTWLKHGGWWPDHQLRLIKKLSYLDWPPHIHSTPAIEGSCGVLTNPIVHFFHGDVSGMVQKTIRFENIESDLLRAAGRKSGTLIFFRKFLGELSRRLIRKAGFADGPIGILESYYQAFSKTVTYLYLYEKQKSRAV